MINDKWIRGSKRERATAVFLRPEVKERLRKYSLENKVFMTDIISVAVTKYLETL